LSAVSAQSQKSLEERLSESRYGQFHRVIKRKNAWTGETKVSTEPIGSRIRCGSNGCSEAVPGLSLTPEGAASYEQPLDCTWNEQTGSFSCAEKGPQTEARKR